MLLPNPNRHFPTYRATVVLKDGRIGTVTGDGEGETIYIPGEEEDIYGVEVVGVAPGSETPPVLWILGDFKEWDENWKKLPALKPEPEPKSEPESEPEPEPEEEPEMPNDPPEDDLPSLDEDPYPDWENEVNE